MSPATLNIILVGIILLFALNGFLQGLIHMLGSIVGLVFGVVIASRLNLVGGAYLSALTGWNKDVCTIVAFVLILLIITRVFGLVTHLIEKTFKIMKIPLVGLANKIAGGLLGFFEGVLSIGATLIIIRSLPFVEFVKTINASEVALSFIASAVLLLPLLPKTIRDLYAL